MNVFILGSDGYIGWNLVLYLGRKRNDDFILVDNFSKRELVKNIGSDSLTPISSMEERIKAYEEDYKKKNLKFFEGDIKDKDFIFDLLETYKPDAVINFAQQPSAPFSMKDYESALYTIKNNGIANLTLLWAIKEKAPDTHLIKLGSMDEYGFPNVDIPEGYFDAEIKGKKDKLPFPKQGESFYHLTKISDTDSIAFACKVWGIKATDVMQGVVYGLNTEETHNNGFTNDERLLSRFDYDSIFGTVMNRFIVQAVVKYPLTVYGEGYQNRGMIHIKDSCECFNLFLDNPPEKNEHRIINQFTNFYFIRDIANLVQRIGKEKGYNTKIQNIKNLRYEEEHTYFNPEHKKIFDLGLKPHNIEEEISKMFDCVAKYKDRVKEELILPTVSWK